MSQASDIREWEQWCYERACHYNNWVPGTNVRHLEELSGPDGIHVTLFREAHHTDEDIDKAKRSARNSWDVTGFSVIKI